MSNPTELDNIIAKIKKLQALAGNNNSKNEILAATAAAERLIAIHRITQAQLEAEQVVKPEAFYDEVILAQGRRLSWIETLLRGLCDHWGGDYYLYSHRDRNNKGETIYTCIAKKSDWHTIHYFLNYLIFEIDRLAKKQMKGQGISASNSFRCGCADGVNSLWKELRDAARKLPQNSTALVVLDQRAKDAHTEMHRLHRLGSASAVFGGRDASARAAGFSAGRNININRSPTKL